MEAALEAALVEMYTTDHPQVILSALAHEALVQEPTTTSSMRDTLTWYLQTPLLPDLVRGLSHRLWDLAVERGSGNAFDGLDDEDIENLTDNVTVKKAFEALIPLSKKREPRLSLLIDAYCTDGCTIEERRILGVSRSFDQQDQLDMLTAIMIAQQRGSEWQRRNSKPRYWPRVLLGLVEVEHLIHCPPLAVARFASALTYICDTLGPVFTLWLNISDDDPSLPQEVKQTLGRRFIARITRDLTPAE